MLLRVLKDGFATKLQAASTKNKKDSAGKRLGVKIFSGSQSLPNDILIRQRGFKWRPGINTHVGRDHTIHSDIEGAIKFTKEYQRNRKITTIHVVPKVHVNKKFRAPMPYCYHPELYPELAQFNPQPTESSSLGTPTRVTKQRAQIKKVEMEQQAALLNQRLTSVDRKELQLTLTEEERSVKLKSFIDRLI